MTQENYSRPTAKQVKQWLHNPVFKALVEAFRTRHDSQAQDLLAWLDSDAVQTVSPDDLKKAVSFNQSRRAAESDMLDADFLIGVMQDEDMLHEEEQSDE